MAGCRWFGAADPLTRRDGDQCAMPPESCGNRNGLKLPLNRTAAKGPQDMGRKTCANMGFRRPAGQVSGRSGRAMAPQGSSSGPVSKRDDRPRFLLSAGSCHKGIDTM